MAKQIWKAGNMLYPLPVVMVTVAGRDGRPNIITVAWTGTVCTNPPMLSISVRPERYSYDLLRETGEFAVNLTTEKLAYATDYCGVRSGRDVDKFAVLGYAGEAAHIGAPLIGESPVNIECRVTERRACGSHDLFLAEVLCVHADEAYMDEKGRFDLAKARPIVYDHGSYYGLGRALGRFGFSVKKPEEPSRSKGPSGSKTPSGKTAGANQPGAKPSRKSEKAGGKRKETGRTDEAGYKSMISAAFGGGIYSTRDTIRKEEL